MEMTKILVQIKKSSIELAQVGNDKKNKFLQILGTILTRNKKKILSANQKDIEEALKKNISYTFIERLKLDKKGIDRILESLRTIQKIKDPVGRILEERRLTNSLLLRKLTVPIGVVLVIYESRPEVTIDVSVLCIKSGNAAILKGGLEASNTNSVLHGCVQEALEKVGLARETVSFIQARSDIGRLVKKNKYIDLVIARGGYKMVRKIQNRYKIPVLAHSAGGARIYVDQSADLKKAENIIINAKISKPSACNSLDTILVHKDIAQKFLPPLIKKLKLLNVEVRRNNWNKEFLDLIVSIKIVQDVNEAIKFIQKYSKLHTEGIVAKDKKVIKKFIASIDTAALFVNCSTRFHDGGVFGMGAEMGISTGKLHARGPVGLKELTSYKWVVYGYGQIRN